VVEKGQAVEATGSASGSFASLRMTAKAKANFYAALRNDKQRALRMRVREDAATRLEADPLRG
jgi:hypothetical protein